jgi:tetratricopeptide (TPR) repeat protein
MPLLALALVFGIINIYAQQEAGAIRSLAGIYSFTDRIFLFTYGLSAYVLMLAAPVHLSAMHYLSHSPGAALPALYYASPLFLIALVAGIMRSGNMKRDVLFGVVFFLVCISVMLQLITVGSAVYAERYTYVASIGLFYVAGQYVSILRATRYRKPATAIAAIILVACAILTSVRCRVWQDGETLFTDVINKEPEAYFGYWMRATYRNEQGMLPEAIADYTAAIERKPDFEDLYYDRGHASQDAGNMPAAIADFTAAIEAKPDMAEAYNDRGWARYKSGDSITAMADILKAIQLKPTLAEAYNNCGAIHSAGGNFQAALPYFDKAIQLKPEYGLPYFNRAAIYANKGSFKAALTDFNTLIELEPANAAAWYTRGLVKYNMKDASGACADWQQAATLGHTQAQQMAAQYCR